MATSLQPAAGSKHSLHDDTAHAAHVEVHVAQEVYLCSGVRLVVLGDVRGMHVVVVVVVVVDDVKI